MTDSTLDRDVVLHHAKVAALWSTSGPEDADYEMLDAVFSPEDVTGEAETELVTLIDNFFELAGDDVEKSGLSAEQVGHDIVLTANRHGAGFWDRGLGEIGDKLTEAAHSAGSYELYVGDDGKLYA